MNLIDLNIFKLFQPIAVIFYFLDAQIVLSLASGGPFKLAPVDFDVTRGLW